MTSRVDRNVSRETNDVLKEFQQDLLKWNARINLIAKSTLDDAWDRHIQDSAQLFQFALESDEKWTDMGSGGGLPGLVIAIMSKTNLPRLEFSLIESDQRKAAFLRQITAKYALNCRIFAQRIEDVEGQNSDVVSARALASLSQLLEYAGHHSKTGGRLLLPKGKTAEQEISEARNSWEFDVVKRPSLTDNQGLILEITNAIRKT